MAVLLKKLADRFRISSCRQDLKQILFTRPQELIPDQYLILFTLLNMTTYLKKTGMNA